MHLPWLLVLCLKSLVCLGSCQGKFRLHMALPLCLCLCVQVFPFYKDIVILDQGSPSWPHFNLIQCKDPNSKQDHIHRDQGLGFQHFLKGCDSIHNTRQPWSKNYFTFPLHYCRLSYLKINLTVLLLWASLVAQMGKILLQCRRPRFDPWVRKISWRRAWQPTPVFLPRKSNGQRSLVGYSPWGQKSQTQLSD